MVEFIHGFIAGIFIIVGLLEVALLSRQLWEELRKPSDLEGQLIH